MISIAKYNDSIVLIRDDSLFSVGSYSSCCCTSSPPPPPSTTPPPDCAPPKIEVCFRGRERVWQCQPQLGDCGNGFLGLGPYTAKCPESFPPIVPSWYIVVTGFGFAAEFPIPKLADCNGDFVLIECACLPREGEYLVRVMNNAFPRQTIRSDNINLTNGQVINRGLLTYLEVFCC
jgi:hypothetical protein